MKLSNDDVNAVVKTQISILLFAIMFASGYALFAKLIWSGKFPILIFLPLLMVGFALASINHTRSFLAQYVDADA